MKTKMLSTQYEWDSLARSAHTDAKACKGFTILRLLKHSAAIAKRKGWVGDNSVVKFMNEFAVHPNEKQDRRRNL